MDASKRAGTTEFERAEHQVRRALAEPATAAPAGPPAPGSTVLSCLEHLVGDAAQFLGVPG
jgi:hypothetical protein